MKVSLNWLAEWVDLGSDVAALSHALTMAGLEIEGQSRAAPDMSGVVVAEVRATEKHPDAEKLSVCRVFDGTQEIQIVCGASNVRAGIKVPLATVGATLPGGLQIKQAQLRGVASSGMLCSAKELGLAEESSGLLELPADLAAGTDLVKALQLDDVILEINLTPNRGDCMSILGVAREVAASRGISLKAHEVIDVAPTLPDVHPVKLESDGCRKFVSRVIKGVTPGASSPWWLKERLRRAGVRSVNAVVDVTNYVMLELGQPMHAYDLAKLQGGVVVRSAKFEEPATLLDGKTIALAPDVLVIADSSQVLGMAGVMGGLGSAISDATTDVLLEVASFEPDAIAGRGRRYGLVTDASQRFERGVDPNLQERAMQRATGLLVSVAGGAAGPMQVTGHNETVVRPAITLRLERVTKVLGINIDSAMVAKLLNSLGMRIQMHSSNEWQVTPPSWRFDVSIEEDLIEEIARSYGYDNISTIEATAAQSLHPVTEGAVTIERAALLLVDRGYQEVITYSFTDASIQASLLAGQSGLALSNPISAELGVMRLSLWPGLIEVLKTNLRRQQSRVRVFETGRLFSADGRVEGRVLAGLVAGTIFEKQWSSKSADCDFFDVKADVDALLGLTSARTQFQYVPDRHAALHPGQCARILRNGQPVGWLGALNPAVAKALDVDGSAVLFEFDIESSSVAQVPEYHEISRFPGVRRDLAVVVGETLAWDELRDAVTHSAGSLLKDLTIFDVYHGAGVEKGKKSMALGLYLQDTSRTLTDAEVDATITSVVGHLQQRFAAQLRDR